MFHRANNASKVALNFLVGHLRQRGFWLFDIQMVTAATRLLGAKAIPRSEYLERLAVAVTRIAHFREIIWPIARRNEQNQPGNNSARISFVFLTNPIRGKILATVSVCSSSDRADIASSAKI